MDPNREVAIAARNGCYDTPTGFPYNDEVPNCTHNWRVQDQLRLTFWCENCYMSVVRGKTRAEREKNIDMLMWSLPK
jgi:hypothetical protein